MKKLSIILSMAIAVSAFAKTQSELAAEQERLVKSGMSQWSASIQVYTENQNDVASYFDAWKGSNIAKFTIGEPEYGKLSKEQRNEALAIRKIFTQYMLANPNVIKDVPKRVACLSIPSKCSAYYESDFYSSLKATDFVLDGVKLPAYARIHLAEANGDIDYVKSMPIEDGMKAASVYFEVIFSAFLESPDLEGSIQKCNEIENYILKNKQYNSPYLNDLKSIAQILTRRMVNAKISGK